MDDDYEDTATCPECHQPNVHPMSTVGDRRHYRCHGCLHSWWTPVQSSGEMQERGVPNDH